MKTAHPFIDRTSLVIVGDRYLEAHQLQIMQLPATVWTTLTRLPEIIRISVIVPVDSLGRMTERPVKGLNP